MDIYVVVPIYNVERYLAQCLDSLLSQSYGGFKAILVDDKSSDKSLDIAKRYATKDKRIHLITHEINQGLSGARNTAIEYILNIANDGYITFLDSDDMYSADFLQGFMQAIESNGIVDSKIILHNKNIVSFKDKEMPKDDRKITQIYQTIKKFNQKNLKIGANIWKFAFHISLLKASKIRFIDRMTMEDEGFLFMILPFASGMVEFVGSGYHYRQRADSITANNNKTKSLDRIKVFEKIYLSYKKNNFLGKFPLPLYMLYDVSYKDKEYYFSYLKASYSLAIKLGLDKNAYKCDKNMLLSMMLKNQKTFYIKYKLAKVLPWII